MGTTDQPWQTFRSASFQILHFIEVYLRWMEAVLRAPLHRAGVPPGWQLFCVIVAAIALLLLGLRVLEGLLKVVIVFVLAVVIVHLLWGALHV
jgi:hypothetical protein